MFPDTNTQANDKEVPNLPLAFTDKPGPEWLVIRSVEEVAGALEEALKRFESDAGSKALDALNRVQKENRRKTVRRRWWWAGILFLLSALLGGVGYFAFLNVKIEPHSFIRTCRVKYGDGLITGTREYLYKSRSLFGWELTQKSDMEFKTTIALKNDKITILGLDDDRKIYWRMNFGIGDRGDQPVKPANEYIFIGEKADAMITSDAFCP